jgi:putative ABC transport system permease protein
MTIRDALRTALEMIWDHKLRAFFTILGTVVGVTFLIAVITLIQGMDAYMKDEFAGQIYGVNTVMVRRTPSVRMTDTPELLRELRRRPRITFDDAEWLRERLETPGLLSVSSSTGGTIDGPQGGSIEGARVIGASAEYFRVRSANLQLGRVFHSQEAERGLPVVVIGQEVAQMLFPNTNPIGGTVRIQGHSFQVIGVMERQGSLFGLSLDNQVIAPAKSRVNGFVNPYNVVDEITFQVPHAMYMDAAMAELEGWMRIRHQLRPDQVNDFELETAEASMSFWTRISQIMFVALPGLVGVSLIVGAVVIMNIMLVSVTERTREIGLRKSLGARRKDILRQFLIESGTLSGLGGVLGIALGGGLAAVVSSVSPLPAQVAPWSIALGLALGVGVGMAAGAYPAYRAAGLDPIEALRHE